MDNKVKIKKDRGIKSECVKKVYIQNQKKEDVLKWYKEKTGNNPSLKSFNRRLRFWKQNLKDEEKITDRTIFEKFGAKKVTIQYNAEKDKITQAWVQQTPDKNQFQEIVPIIKKLKPFVFKTTEHRLTDSLLEIPLFDMHFGISSLNDYDKHLNELLDLIKSKHRDNIVFVIGQDLFHNNDFRGQTAGGTHIQSVDMPKAYSDAFKFYYALIEQALLNANQVEIIFSKGNHDESIAWAFVKMLEQVFPQCKFDTGLADKKVRKYGEVFIGWSHGDKGRKKRVVDIRGVFAELFKKEWATTSVRELHFGHLHHEITKDEYGFTVRNLSSATLTDDWHWDNDFVGAHKRFMCFEYTSTKLNSTYYIG